MSLIQEEQNYSSTRNLFRQLDGTPHDISSFVNLVRPTRVLCNRIHVGYLVQPTMKIRRGVADRPVSQLEWTILVGWNLYIVSPSKSTSKSKDVPLYSFRYSWNNIPIFL